MEPSAVLRCRPGERSRAASRDLHGIDEDRRAAGVGAVRHAVRVDDEHRLLDGERDRDLGRRAGDRAGVHDNGVGVRPRRAARRV